ncbi:MAG: hypothetical protein J5693_01560 [Bacteroidales bacterium]|nr:hypothetical protein [Bacteroidales bacterium]
MKKYIVIALAAVVAFSACTKVEKKTVDEKISFEVASYVPQTRATSGTSLLSEGCTSFFTNAWYNPVSGAAQYYMQNVEVKPDATTNPTQWAPEDAYYWPKTGKINFFSYASVNALPATGSDAELDFGASENPEGTKFTITNHTVVADDNIMIADAVYNASRANKGQNDITDTENTNNPTGVPTLFRHLLAQVSFNVGLATRTATTGTTNYEATITSAVVKSVLKQGTLVLTAGASDAETLNTKAWAPAADGTKVGWTAGTATENITLTNPTNKLKLAAGATTGNVENMLTNRTVLPQTLADAVVLEIVYNLDTKHGDDVYTSETGLKVTALLNSVTTIPSWNMNQRITYNVTIDPVTDIITFDPAVVAWTTATGAISYLVP